MEQHQVNILKNYRVVRHPIKGAIYEGDCSGLAYWFYVNVDCTTGINDEGVLIHVNGDFHETFGFDIYGNKNPDHLTVIYEYAGHQSPRHHMSIDSRDGQSFFSQSLGQGGIKKKRTKKKKKKKKKKK